MARKRSSRRRRAPLAAIIAVIVLGSAAIALDSYNLSTQKAQLAATGAILAAENSASTPNEPITGTQPTTPEGATSEKVCINDSSISVVIGTGANSAPKTEKKCWAGASAGRDGLCPNPGNPPQPQPKEGCFVRFCTLRTPTATDASTERCTEEVYYKNDAAMQAAMPSTNMAAANIFAETVLDQGAGQVDPGQITSGMPVGTSQLITGAFEQQQQMGIVEDVRTQWQAADRAALECLGQYGAARCGNEIDAQSQAQTRLTQEEAKLRDLQSEAQALSGQQGTVGTLQNCPGGPGCDGGTWNPQTNTTQQPPTQQNCPGGPNCPGGTWNPRTQTLQQQQPPTQQCSTMQRILNLGSCPTNLPYNPSSPYGAYNPYGAQQRCNAMQQIISGCPNPFMPGQQQCGGLMAALNKCPAGSYNPNNPSNPYNYPAPTCTIQVSPQNATAGQAVTLQWQSQGAQYANISGLGQVGPSGSTTVYPQGPMTYVMNVVGYGNQQGQCQTQFGSGSGTGGAPTAQISCQPLTADIGTQVSVSYACQNAATSVGSGFSTGGSLSGSTVVTVGAPSLGQHTINYGLTCSNQGQTNSAQCTINVNKAAIVLVANPKAVESGEEANIGWVTSGMDSCIISSSNSAFTSANASSTSVSGAAKTPALTEDESFTLTCETKTGVTKIASTTVQVTD